MNEDEIEELIEALESVTDEGSCGVANRAVAMIRRLQRDLAEAVGYRLAIRAETRGDQDRV